MRQLSWSLLGFVAGTALVTPLVLSIDPWERLQAGALLGGGLGALVGFVAARYAAAARQRRESSRGT